MWATIRADLGRKAEWYGLRNTAGARFRMLFRAGTTAQLLLRVTEALLFVGPLSELSSRLIASWGHATIGRGVTVGPGLVLLQSSGISIASSVRAGRNLTLQHGVTIGAQRAEGPVLGDNVFVGAGARVLGAIRIGSDVKISANAVVMQDVPDGATVVGAPGRVVRVYGEKVAASAPPQPTERSSIPAASHRRRPRSHPLASTAHEGGSPVQASMGRKGWDGYAAERSPAVPAG